MRSGRRIGGIAVAILIAACSDTTDPGPPLTQFGREISLTDFETQVTGTAFVEIEFETATGIVAREIEVGASRNEEKVSSAVLGMNPTAGTLTLRLAGGSLVVSYATATRFRTATNDELTRNAFETQVLNAISGGGNTPIEVRRPLPATPQVPTTSTFTATDLRLLDDLDETKIEVLVDADNFEDVASPPPLAILRVFHIPVQITTTTRLERLTSDSPPAGTEVEFEAPVVAASVAGGTLTLADGTVIQIGTATTFDAAGDLLTLAAVATAIGSGDSVRVEGRGTVQSVGPPATIAATTVKLEADD